MSNVVTRSLKNQCLEQGLDEKLDAKKLNIFSIVLIPSFNPKMSSPFFGSKIQLSGASKLIFAFDNALAYYATNFFDYFFSNFGFINQAHKKDLPTMKLKFRSLINNK